VVGYTLQPQPSIKETQIPSDGRLGRTDSQKTLGGKEKNLLEIFMVCGEFTVGRNTDKIRYGFPQNVHSILVK
jgi:hypothetical protein